MLDFYLTDLYQQRGISFFYADMFCVAMQAD